LNVRWAPFTNLQATADWSRSNDRRNSAFAQSVTGREIVSLHVLALIGRRVQVDASAGMAERATPRENRQGSVTVTWAFGR
jgi:spore germination cell wall hydrolase CwlJ-like protein